MKLIKEHTTPIDNFQVLGERCSGTNFLTAFIARNTGLTQSRHLGWKHGYPAFISVPRSTLVFLIVRNAHSWVRSMYSKPWHASPEIKALDFSSFLRAEWVSYVDKPGYFRLPERDKKNGEILQLDRHPITGEAFANLIQMRNLKNQAFLGLQNRKCNLVICQHEWLVDNIVPFQHALEEAFGLDFGGTAEVPKEHFGWSWPDRAKQIQKPGKDLSEEDYAFLYTELDHEMEARLGYTYGSPEAIAMGAPATVVFDLNLGVIA